MLTNILVYESGEDRGGQAADGRRRSPRTSTIQSVYVPTNQQYNCFADNETQLTCNSCFIVNALRTIAETQPIQTMVKLTVFM